MRARLATFLKQGQAAMHGIVTNDAVHNAMYAGDVILLTSNYEGLPLALLEAMARGCVPVVSDVQSGIPGLIRRGENGFRVTVGDISGFVDTLVNLATDGDLLRRVGREAYLTIAKGPYSVERMASAYAKLFERCRRKTLLTTHRPGPGAIEPPDWLLAGDAELEGQ